MIFVVNFFQYGQFAPGVSAEAYADMQRAKDEELRSQVDESVTEIAKLRSEKSLLEDQIKYDFYFWIHISQF